MIIVIWADVFKDGMITDECWNDPQRFKDGRNLTGVSFSSKTCAEKIHIISGTVSPSSKRS